jgi:hypothetical protein
MDLEVVKMLTGTGADSVTIIIGWVLLKHEMRIQKLETTESKKAA